MPLLSDAKSLFVGTQPITKVMAGTQLVWPKSCEYDKGRPDPLPPENNGPAMLCSMAMEDNNLKVSWSSFNRPTYLNYEIDLFDTQTCKWVKQGNTSTTLDEFFVVDKRTVNDFQTYDARVTGVNSAGQPDQSMWRYSTNYLTVPDRRIAAPIIVQTRMLGPGVLELSWSKVNDLPGDPVTGYQVQYQNPDTKEWEFFYNFLPMIFKITLGSNPDGLYPPLEDGKSYRFEVAAITFEPGFYTPSNSTMFYD